MEKEKQSSELPRSIENRFGSIRKTDHSNIEVNIISWNNGRKKLDIRVWSSDGKSPKKGVAFSREEYLQLVNLLVGVDPMLIDCGKDFERLSQEKQEACISDTASKMSFYCDAIQNNAASAECPQEEYVELDFEEHFSTENNAALKTDETAEAAS